MVGMLNHVQCSHPYLQKMKVVPVSPETYGKFYEGDSYIVLHVSKHNVTRVIVSLYTVNCPVSSDQCHCY